MATLLLALLAAILPLGNHVDATTSRTFTPQADTYLAGAQNFGTASYLIVGNSPARSTFMKFATSNLSGQITRARLRLRVSSTRDASSDSAGTLRSMSNTSWSETSLTPSEAITDGPVLGTLGRVAKNKWYEFDVTRAVTGNGTFSFALTSLSSDAASYNSRESGAYAPQLVVETLSPTASPSLSPTASPSPVPTTTPSTSPSPTTENVDVDLKVDRATPVGVSQLAMGVTHTQYSADPWNDALAVSSAKQLLKESASFQNQHIMGWGALNPEPSPGQYSWSSLDGRVNLMRSTGVTPVITLCCSPDWMKGGSPGTTDWSRIEVAPTSDHYDDFANLAAKVALRYPDVSYFQVWNEMKGFYNASLNRWDYEGYTRLYNMVYDAVKAVRPDAKIGGPYVVMDSWSSTMNSHPSSVSGPYGNLDRRPLDVIAYWLKNKHGADFLSLDGGTTNKDGRWVTDEFTAQQKFKDVTSWIRRLDDTQHPGAATLPIWWSEWYPRGSQNWANLDHFNAVMTSGLIATMQSGSAVALVWQPQGDQAGFSYDEGIWTDTRVAGGGKATPLSVSLKGVRTHFAPGTKLYAVSGIEPSVSVVSSGSTTLVVNRTSSLLSVAVNGVRADLPPYGVRFVALPS